MTETWLVVLNWHGRADTLELLQNLTQESATVVVVDNGSHDGTLEAAAALYPALHTLQTGANLGYAGGNNAGIEYAIAHGAEVIGVLNNDTVVEPGFLAPLLHHLHAQPRAAVSPDIRYAGNPDRSWWRGSFFDHHTAWFQHIQPEDLADGTDPIPTPVLTGCCIVARTDVWRDVGLFDEGLFLIFEDTDWSRRAAGAGIALYAVPQSQILHKVSRSFTGEAATRSGYYFARNGVLVARRYGGRRAALRFATRQVLRTELPRVRTPAGRMALRGLWDASRSRMGPLDR